MSQGNFDPSASQQHEVVVSHSSTNALDAYTFLEEWWGEKLGPALIERIAESPPAHRLAYSQAWGDAHWYWEVQRSIPTLSRGQVRPVIPTAGLPREAHISMALRVLLYSSEAVLSSDVIHPNLHSSPNRLRDELMFMMQIRPLIEKGLLRFYWKNPDHESTEASREGLLCDMVSEIYPKEVEQEWRTLPGLENLSRPRLRGQLSNVAFDIAPSYFLAGEGRATPIVMTPREALAWRRLSGDDFRPSRPSNLQRFASMTVPDLRGNIANLVNIRLADDGFFQVREIISSALAMQNNSEDFDENLLAGEMRLAALRLSKSMKSPILQSMALGKKELAFAALSMATTSLVAGNIGAGVWGAGAAIVGKVAWEAAENKKRSAMNQSIHNVLMAFGDENLV